jgi:outer membrane protein assembly factor BamB
MSIVRHLALLLLLLGGCSQLRIKQSFLVRPNDWTTFGGDSTRTNRAHAVITPPLHRQWEYDAGAGFGPPSSPAVAEGKAFVANLQGEIHVVDIATGQGTGTFDFGSAIAGTPSLANGLIYFGLAHDEESVLCYEVQNAEVRWKAKAGDVEAAPLLLGNTLFVTTMNGRLVALDAFDGTERWAYTVPARGALTGIRSSPASDGQNVFFGCDDGSMYAVSADRGELRWSAATGASVVATPAVSGGSVFVGSLDGTFYAFDAASGAVLWNTRLGSKIYGAQAVDEAAVYVGASGRSVVSLDRRTGEIRWRTAVGGLVDAAPLLSGPVVYIGAADKVLYALEAASGKIIATDTLPGRVRTTPTAWGGYLLVLAEDRTMIAFKGSEAP